MLHVPGVGTARRTAPVSGTFGAANDFGGIALSQGTSGAYGAWTQLVSGASLNHDGFLVLLGALLEYTTFPPYYEISIGVDPAGGTSYVDVVSDLLIGIDNIAIPLFLYVAAGSSVAARLRTPDATSALDTNRFAIVVQGVADHSHVPLGRKTQTLGRMSVGRGTDVTGTLNAWSAWTSLGTLTNPAHYLFLAGTIFSSTAVIGSIAFPYIVELAVGDGTNYITLCRTTFNSSAGQTRRVEWDFITMPVDLPAGATLYARGYNKTANVFIEVEALAIG